MVKESLKNFSKYSASDEELFMYIRINAGEWNEESFVKMKKLVREVIKDYENEECYPKIFIITKERTGGGLNKRAIFFAPLFSTLSVFPN